MFNPQHCGLFFTTQQLEYARKNAAREPFAAALNALRQQQAEGVAAVQWAALRYRFLQDHDAGEIALTTLVNLLAGDVERLSYFDLISESLVLAQVFELLREHPAATPAHSARWRDWLHDRVGLVNEHVYDKDLLETTWTALLNMAAGVVLEREPVFAAGIRVFQDVVAREISPRGHVEFAVKHGVGSAMLRSVLAVEALVLMAEIAAHSGVDLWRYEVRGVSVMTGALYPIYYFYVTDKWQWEAISPEEVQAIFRAHGGYLEIINRRHQPRDIKPLLEDLRPIYDPRAGGLVTLTHGLVLRRGLFG